MTVLVLVITTIRISGENFEESHFDLDFGDDDKDRTKFCYCPERAVNAQLAQAKVALADTAFFKKMNKYFVVFLNE